MGKIDFRVETARDGSLMDPPLLPFQLQDPERLCKEFATADLKGTKVESITETA